MAMPATCRSTGTPASIRARPAATDGNRHARDVAHAYATGKSGNESLKRRNTVRIIALFAAAEHLFDTASEQAELYETGGNCKKQPCPQQYIHQPCPHRIVDFLNPLVQRFGKVIHKKPF